MILPMNKTFVLLLLSWLIGLPTSPAFSNPLHETDPAPGSCTLPPPAIFTVVEEGPTWVTLSWSPVPFAVAYHIVTREVSTGTIVDDSTIPASTMVHTINNLTPSTQYESRIWSVCANGQDGPTHNTTFPETIIIELVDTGYTPPETCLTPGCEMKFEGDGCKFPWLPNTRTYFYISSPGGIQHHFMVETPDNVVDLYPEVNGNTGFSFLPGGGQYVAIHFAGNFDPEVAQISATHFSAAPEGLLFRQHDQNNNPDFPIYRLDPCKEPKLENAPVFDRSVRIRLAAPEGLTAAPNPFRNELTVTTAFSGPFTLRLFDLHGRQLLVQCVPDAREGYTLPVADLPEGVYLLRAESGADTRTIKVVKTNR